MALLGLVSLAQIWFIPGYLLLYRLTDISWADKVLLAVPLSAVINFFLVYMLVALGAYTQFTLLTFLCIEITFLAYLIWKAEDARASLPADFRQVSINFDFDLSNSIFFLILLVFGIQAFNQIGTVFTQGDAVTSWNPWAVAWYKGTIPHNIWWYPQLLPTLYSITYQFIGNSQIELFAKIGESFYPFFALAMAMRMAVLLPSERKKILWSAIIFFLLVRRLWGSESAINGYADFPLAFFAIAIAYVFVLRLNQQNNGITKSAGLAWVLVGVATGACLTKHSGVYLGMLTPFFWLYYFRETKPFKAHFRQSAQIGIAIAAICATWYLYQAWRISMGTETSNLKMLSEIVRLPWYKSIAYGFESVTHKLSWLWVLLFSASLAHRQIRYLAIFAVTPLFLLWAAFVPYDYRNLAPVFPLLAITLAYGWGELARFALGLSWINANLKLIQRSSLLLLLTVLAFALSDPKLDSDLLRLSVEAKSQIGDPEINSRLTAYFEFNPAPALVATPYQELQRLPDIGQRFTPFSCGGNYGASGSTVALSKILDELSAPGIGQILLLPWCDPNVWNYFANHPEKYHLVFQHNGTTFYEIRSGN